MAGRKIADISAYQGDIDWDRARAELGLAVFRASVGGNADAKYLENTAKCGIPYGAYHYVKAGTAEEAEAEARFFAARANMAARKPLFYIADIEDKAQTEATTEAVCRAFLETLKAQGCGRIGLYINTKYAWAGAAVELCDVMWIPHWGLNDGRIPDEAYAPKRPCDLWQYTSVGRVDGIGTAVDLNTPRDGRTLEWFTAGWSDGDAGSGLTNRNLAAYCEEAYRRAWVYWYGACGYECSEALYKRKKEQYPSEYGDARANGYRADIRAGKMCADCVGMIKSFFWKGGDIDGKNVYQSHNCPDRSADGLFALCSERGPIGKIPDTPGLVVHKGGHIGVYVGGGYTVEMRGFAYDCVRRKVSEGPWTEWGRLPDSMLEYADGLAGDGDGAWAFGDRMLKKGCSGSDVKALQEALMKLGYPLNIYGADGDYGAETDKAVKAFQNDRGLEADGIFGPATLKAMGDALAGAQEREEPDTPDGGGEAACALVIEGKREMLETIRTLYGGTLVTADAVRAVMAEGALV